MDEICHWEMKKNIVGEGKNIVTLYFHAPVSKDRGHIVLPLSVCTNLTWKLNIFPLLLNQFSYKAHVWYEGTSHLYTSPGTKVKVICKVQGQILGSCFSIDGCFLGISVSQTHLVLYIYGIWFVFLYSTGDLSIFNDPEEFPNKESNVSCRIWVLAWLFLAHLSTTCSRGAFRVTGCPSCVVNNSLNINSS